MSLSDFLTPLDVRYRDGRTWEVLTAFAFVSEPSHARFVVPAGFVTDFASIPRFFWRLFPPTGPYGKAACLHDYLYRAPIMTRQDADTLFLEAMTVLGVPWVTRSVMYRAVRLFGGRAQSRP